MSPLVMPALFTTSPLIDGKFAGRDDIAVAYRDPRVQAAASSLATKIDDLLFVIGYHSSAALGVRAILKEAKGQAITADAIAQRLREYGEQVDEHIVCAKEIIAEHDAAARDCLERHRPLRNAVNDQLTQLTVERDRLFQDEQSERRTASLPATSSRYSKLRDAGLTEAQIQAADPTALSTVKQAECRQARMAEITPIIEKLQTFQSDPFYSAVHLAGLSEFEALVTARDGEKAAA